MRNPKKCGICGKEKTILYKCEECGKYFCVKCGDHEMPMCTTCKDISGKND
jgi:hypothetical protein